ncbi:hypothetical protein BHE74_00044947 [Ensete ventricosum]|nr:hypothetical protein BHE74_00044947 [Ensete ventricosum]RZS18615.1 hypothetical protein BHM03_00050922 [Ensete ventricosum]
MAYHSFTIRRGFHDATTFMAKLLPGNSACLLALLTNAFSRRLRSWVETAPTPSRAFSIDARRVTRRSPTFSLEKPLPGRLMRDERVTVHDSWLRPSVPGARYSPRRSPRPSSGRDSRLFAAVRGTHSLTPGFPSCFQPPVGGPRHVPSRAASGRTIPLLPDLSDFQAPFLVPRHDTVGQWRRLHDRRLDRRGVHRVRHLRALDGVVSAVLALIR